MRPPLPGLHNIFLAENPAQAGQIDADLNLTYRSPLLTSGK